MSFAAQGLNVSIGGHIVCRAMDFELPTGMSLAVLGRNGAGKSTLLATLAGLRRPDAGIVRIAERALDNIPGAELARIRAYGAQQQYDAFATSVLETALIGRHPHLTRWQWESESDVSLAKEALAQVGLADFAHRQVHTLSSGERQRLALASLLVQAPQYYLLDEPLSHLDLNHAMATLQLLDMQCTAGKTVIAVMHEPNLARRHFDYALLLFGDGNWAFGRSGDVIIGEQLNRLYAYSLRALDDAGKAWFIPD